MMIAKEMLSAIFRKAMESSADFAELYLEDTNFDSVVLMDRKVHSVNSGRSYGVGLRLYKGFNSVYVYSNDATEQGLLKLAENAARALGAKLREGLPEFNFVEKKVNNIHVIEKRYDKVKVEDKIRVVKTLDLIAREESNLIKQVISSFRNSEKKVFIANSEGLIVNDNRVRSRLTVNVVAANDTESQEGYQSAGYHMGFEMLEKKVDLEKMAKNAVSTAVTMLTAPYAPAGLMPVVISGGNGGTIFHEACGHSLEATSVARGLSELSGKLGQKIASDVVSAVDDGTMPGEFGSQLFDDEGTPTQKNVLIENGVLKNYLIDRLNARRMGLPVTGSSRRESYDFEPTSRMTNTYICAGKDDPEDIIKSTSYGLYAKRIGGGSVSPATGEFNFAVNEGYLIKNGQLTTPVRGASLVGRGSEVLMKIDKVGNDLSHAIGMCGSLSGSVPVTVGQPTIRVSELVVGGKEAEDGQKCLY